MERRSYTRDYRQIALLRLKFCEKARER